MLNNTQKLISYIRGHGGVSRFAAIIKAGYHRDTLRSAANSNRIEKIGRGLYRIKDNIPSQHPDLVTASLQSPRGVICLVSALSFHEATTEIPRYVDIAIPRGAHANKVKYPPVRFYQFSYKAWKAGIEEHHIDGNIIKVYNLAKTVADCFKFRNKIGIDIAREALKTAISEKNVKPTEILNYARICRVDNIVKPLLEVMM